MARASATRGGNGWTDWKDKDWPSGECDLGGDNGGRIGRESGGNTVRILLGWTGWTLVDCGTRVGRSDGKRVLEEDRMRQREIRMYDSRGPEVCLIEWLSGYKILC